MTCDQLVNDDVASQLFTLKLRAWCLRHIMNLIVKRQLVRLDKYRHFSKCAKTSNLWRAGSNPERIYFSWAKLVSQVVLLVMEAILPNSINAL